MLAFWLHGGNIVATLKGGEIVNTKQVNIYMEEKFHNKIKRAARKMKVSVAAYARIALSEKMEKEAK